MGDHRKNAGRKITVEYRFKTTEDRNGKVWKNKMEMTKTLI